MKTKIIKKQQNNQDRCWKPSQWKFSKSINADSNIGNEFDKNDKSRDKKKGLNLHFHSKMQIVKQNTQ
jgi:hypothetical protein